MKVYDDERLYDERRARSGPCCGASSTRCAARIAARRSCASLGLLGALELEAPADAVGRRSAGELAARKLSLHVDGKRGTAIFAPPLCITEQELVTGMRCVRRCGRGSVRSVTHDR